MRYVSSECDSDLCLFFQRFSHLFLLLTPNISRDNHQYNEKIASAAWVVTMKADIKGHIKDYRYLQSLGSAPSR